MIEGRCKCAAVVAITNGRCGVCGGVPDVITNNESGVAEYAQRELDDYQQLAPTTVRELADELYELRKKMAKIHIILNRGHKL